MGIVTERERTNYRTKTSSGKDITRRRKKGKRGGVTIYDNKARTKKTGDAKHWRRDPKRRMERG